MIMYSMRISESHLDIEILVARLLGSAHDLYEADDIKSRSDTLRIARQLQCARDASMSGNTIERNETLLKAGKLIRLNDSLTLEEKRLLLTDVRIIRDCWRNN